MATAFAQARARVNYLSVCSGIEAASVAWQRIGWRAIAYSEIEKFPCAVLARHYPNTPNFGDMTKFEDWPDANVDVLVGGTPCQSFSLAGLRKGLDDPRGNLMLTYLAIARRYRPRWLVWENVPGVLSSNGGRDFGAFLGGLAKLGYGFAYRVLDAQFFGVAQRRRRVFVVGHLGGWRGAAAVLFERHSLSRHPPSRDATGQGVAPAIAGGAPYSRTGNARVEAEAMVATYDVAPSLTSSGRGVERTGESRGQDPVIAQCLNAGAMQRQDGESETLIAHSLRGNGIDAGEDGTGRGTPLVPVAFDCKASARNGLGVGEVAPTLRAMGHGGGHCNGGGQVAVAVSLRGREGGATAEVTAGAQPALRASQGGGDKPHVLTGMAVRRLTPRECERLQGFPDDYTRVPYRNKSAENCPDGPRYKALGNSFAVPVVNWIGRRMQIIEENKQ